jgi:hypothetical protein
MAVLTEGQYTGEFIESEANGSQSRENITVLSGEVLKAGHVVGRRLVSPTFGTMTALGTNTGNGTPGAVTMGTNNGARRGTYRVVITEPGANVGTFEVIGPDGQVVGDGVVATLFDNEIQFTLADGATDFVAGDAFTVEVSAGTYKYKEYDVADADGGQRAWGVLYAAVDATGADKPGVLIARSAEVRAGDLQWFSGATQAQKDIAADKFLAPLGIIVRA